jgi:mono/diheme cytochrome c family protein
MKKPFVFGCVLVAGLEAGLTLRAQTTGPQTPPLVIRSLAGRDLFDFYCATCHGRNGKGNGPVAVALRTPPPDLTMLARRHEGIFPRQQVEMFVTNDSRAPTAHGSVEMPVWGPVFRGLDPSDMLAKVRIANVVDYLALIQAK